MNLINTINIPVIVSTTHDLGNRVLNHTCSSKVTSYA